MTSSWKRFKAENEAESKRKRVPLRAERLAIKAAPTKPHAIYARARFYSIVKYSSNPVTSNTFRVTSLALMMRITPPVFMLLNAWSSTRRPAEEMYSSLLISSTISVSSPSL